MEILKLITILGPTAVGKTRLAALVANKISAEIISADSRQVYKGMDLGTGKDIKDYYVDNKLIPYHLIDIISPNEEFNVFKFKKLFIEQASEIQDRGKLPILCGGTGLYLDAVLRDYLFAEVPENLQLRTELENKSNDELASILLSLKLVHNKTDLTDRSRLVRAIEIEHFSETANILKISILNSKVFGILMPRETIRQRITLRLKSRLDEGMIDEVQSLINNGVSIERLLSFGLEYKYVTLYLTGKLDFEQMHNQLCTSIHRFAKRQMTWFRRMEKFGVNIIWIDGLLSEEEKVNEILTRINY